MCTLQGIDGDVGEPRPAAVVREHGLVRARDEHVARREDPARRSRVDGHGLRRARRRLAMDLVQIGVQPHDRVTAAQDPHPTAARQRGHAVGIRPEGSIGGRQREEARARALLLFERPKRRERIRRRRGGRRRSIAAARDERGGDQREREAAELTSRFHSSPTPTPTRPPSPTPRAPWAICCRGNRPKEARTPRRGRA
jgi:hypothetical protein